MFNSYVRKTNIIVNRNCKNSQQDTTDIHIFIQQENKISTDVNKWETMKSGSLDDTFELIISQKNGTWIIS